MPKEFSEQQMRGLEVIAAAETVTVMLVEIVKKNGPALHHDKKVLSLIVSSSDQSSAMGRTSFQITLADSTTSGKIGTTSLYHDSVVSICAFLTVTGCDVYIQVSESELVQFSPTNVPSSIKVFSSEEAMSLAFGVIQPA